MIYRTTLCVTPEVRDKVKEAAKGYGSINDYLEVMLKSQEGTECDTTK